MTKTINTANAKLHLSKKEAAKWGTKKLNVTLIEIDELGNFIVKLADSRFRSGTILQFIAGREATKCTKTFKSSVSFQRETHTGYVQNVTRKVTRTLTFCRASEFDLNKAGEVSAYYMSEGLENPVTVEQSADFIA
tara:strand:- start:367 stop:774 length:408 start_codon:yes stop_codon:yes gene_type:complete